MPWTAARKLQTSLVTVFVVLVLPQSLRSAGLPGEYRLTTRWRSLHCRYSPQPNPAVLTEANYPTVQGVLARTLNEFNKLELGVVLPVRMHQTIAVSWMSLGTSPYEIIEDFAATGVEANTNDNLFSVSYAVSPWRRLSVGVNINLAYQNLYGTDNLFGVGADLGVTFRLLNHAVLGEHLAGLALANALPASLGFGEGETQSTLLRLSLLSDYWEQRISSSLEFSLRDLYASTGEFQAVGADAVKTIEWDFDASLSVWILRLFTLHGLVGLQNTGFAYGGFGAGLNVPTVNAGRDMSFLYQFVTTAEEGVSTHSLMARIEMGRHREESYARRMAYRLNVEPNNLYNRALNLYLAGNYWDAYFTFGRIAVEYPEFFKMDWVSYYMGACYEHVDMREAATTDYRDAVSRHPRSPTRPHALLGMMRVAYRAGNHASVQTLMRDLNTGQTPDSLRAAAFYVAGQSHAANGDHGTAIQALSYVPYGHPDYLYAQHSLAIARSALEQYDEAVSHLTTIVNAAPRNPAEQELVNRSLLLLGYLLYEQSARKGTMSQAVAALRRVPTDSRYHEEALVGLGWAAMRSRQWQDCIRAAQELQSSNANILLRAEGGLLEGYALMMQKRYRDAVRVFADALEWLNEYSPLDKEVTHRGEAAQGNRDAYRSVAVQMRQLAGSRQSSAHVGEMVRSLAPEQTRLHERLAQFQELVDNARHVGIFARSVEAVVEDLEYAIAVAQKMGGFRDVIEIRTKQKELDTEIEELKRQVEELDQQ